MKTLKLLWEHYIYTVDTTIGKLYLVYDGKKEYFGYTLEDTVRPVNIKVYEHTAIPTDLEMMVSKFENAHYGKTLILHTEKDGITIKCGKLKWQGCLFHNGNDDDDTAGCVLVAANHPTQDKIQGGLKDKLATIVWDMIDKGYTITAMSINLPQVA